MNIIAAARGLVPDPGDCVHPEYVRAVLELTSDTLGVGNQRQEVHALIWPDSPVPEDY